MIWTFADLIDHLKDVHQFQDSTRAVRNARRAILRSYRDLVRYHSWRYLTGRRETLRVAASQSGTASYAQATRQLTLSAGVWPSGVTNFRVRFNGVTYNIESQVSNDIVTLPADDNPGEDVAAESYIVFRESYPLPVGFRKLVSIFDVQNKREIPCIGEKGMHRLSIVERDTPGRPEVVSIRGDGNILGELTLHFTPAPSDAMQYDLVYDKQSRDLRVERIELAGDASIADGETDVTFAATEVPDYAIGSVIRLSSDASIPTSLIGTGDSAGLDATNPYAVERVIVAVPDANTVTLDVAVEANFVSVGFVISDPLDVSADTMLTALQRLAEAEYAKLQQIGTPEQRASYWTTFQREILEAKAADRREVGYRRRGPAALIETYDPSPVTIVSYP